MSLPLLPLSSPMFRLPLTMPRDLLSVFDGLRYSFVSIDICYLRVTNTATRIHEELSVSNKAELSAAYALLLPSVFADCWLLTDALTRAAALVQRLPRHGNSDAFRSLIEAVRPVRQARNQLQHLDQKIGSLAANGLPVWGDVSWVVGDITKRQAYFYSARASSLREGDESGARIREGITDGVSHLALTLTAFERDRARPGSEVDLDLSNIVGVCRPAVAELEDRVRAFGRAEAAGSDLLLRLETAIETSEVGVHTYQVRSVEVVRCLSSHDV